MSTSISRRESLKRLATAALAAPAIHAARPSPDIQILEVEPSYEDYRYRAPMKFGGWVVDRVTLLNVRCTVKGRNGKTAQGFGSMPMGNVWSFPSNKLTYDQTLAAMKELSAQIARITAGHKEWGHPVDLSMALEPQYLTAAAEISKRLVQPVPPLCTLVTASPFDIALHDA